MTAQGFWSIPRSERAYSYPRVFRFGLGGVLFVGAVMIFISLTPEGLLAAVGGADRVLGSLLVGLGAYLLVRFERSRRARLS